MSGVRFPAEAPHHNVTKIADIPYSAREHGGKQQKLRKLIHKKTHRKTVGKK
jgi:hypothetical protein